MKKKIIALITIFSTSFLAIGGATTAFVLNAKPTLTGAKEDPSLITLNDKTNVISKDYGYYHQIDVRNNKFDMIGYSKTGGDFGSIKKATYGEFEYYGMVYNRSIINGFKTLTATFNGGSLYYVLTDFLMEDMNFNGTALVSGETINVPYGKAYFIIYNPSTTPVNIDSIDIIYTCDGSKDDEMIFNKYTPRGSARSYGYEKAVEDSYIEIENNPTKYNNNYSRGHNMSPTNDDSWYRFNGKYFTQSEELGTDFEFGMTIMGNISQAVNYYENPFDNFFHFNVWPQFTYGDSNDAPWVQTYIGNDNYEPLGSANALRPNSGTTYSYEGRFFGRYDYFNDTTWKVDYDDPTANWRFGNPDVATIADGITTLREAYQRFNLPFWYLNFKVYLNNDNEPTIDVSINGMLIESYEMFEHYDTVNKPSISILTMPMHVINYGKDAEANPANKYVGMFTYPRLINN